LALSVSVKRTLSASAARIQNARLRLLDRLLNASDDGRLKPMSGSWQARGLVFSRDRPLQLHALLTSYLALCEDPAPLSVIYSALTPEYDVAYAQVIEEIGDARISVTSEEELGFRKTLLNELAPNSSSHVFFLVDDIVFTESWRFSSLLPFSTESSIVSLRLGSNLNWSYTNDRRQRVPKLVGLSQFESAAGDPRDADALFSWKWIRGESDWAYPLSLDGNVFRVEPLRQLVSQLDFHSPNSLEARLQKHASMFLMTWGVCFGKSRLVNLPLNRVQNDIPNRHGQISAQELLEVWSDGVRVDTAALRGLVNCSAHQEVTLPLLHRPSHGKS